ncbi:MAG: RidA family protein [Cytophagaceae bacterium]|jgi:2-iminobutanoate/2-iminopropanoate deaminase|nr:RidA family protein [Cytophagaceae bacterium]
MSKKLIYTPYAPEPIGPYSQAVQFGNMIFVSGQIAIHPDTKEIVRGTIEEETHQVMQNLKTVLAEAGYSLQDVVKTSIFVKDLSHFDKINWVYGEYMGESKPARETVEVARLPKDVQVEISCIAAK